MVVVALATQVIVPGLLRLLSIFFATRDNGPSSIHLTVQVP